MPGARSTTLPLAARRILQPVFQEDVLVGTAPRLCANIDVAIAIHVSRLGFMALLARKDQVLDPGLSASAVFPDAAGEILRSGKRAGAGVNVEVSIAIEVRDGQRMPVSALAFVADQMPRPVSFAVVGEPSDTAIRIVVLGLNQIGVSASSRSPTQVRTETPYRCDSPRSMLRCGCQDLPRPRFSYHTCAVTTSGAPSPSMSATAFGETPP